MIPTKKQQQQGTYKLIGGVWHKLCAGPAHEKPEYLPATDKYFYIQHSKGREGHPTAHCRLCKHWNYLKNPGSHHGMVRVSDVRPFYIELANRIGVLEIHRRSGVSLGHIYRVIHNKTHSGKVTSQAVVRKEPVRRVMLELVSAKRKNEFSINVHSKWRQHKRNLLGLDACPGCGTYGENWTKGCKSCYNRWQSRYRYGKISAAFWKKINEEITLTYSQGQLPPRKHKPKPRLTASQKAAIRTQYVPSLVTLKDLAKTYKVSESTIHRIVHEAN